MHDCSISSYDLLLLTWHSDVYAFVHRYTSCCALVGAACILSPQQAALGSVMMSATMCERGTCFAATTSAPRLSRRPQAARPVQCQAKTEADQSKAAENNTDSILSRRAVMSASLASAAVTLLTDAPAHAVQGYTAGRIPGSNAHQPASCCRSLQYVVCRAPHTGVIHV